MSAPDASDRIVFCVGSINADLVMRVGGPPTGTIVADDVAVLPGGKAANVAVMVRALGLRSTLIGAVGADDEGAVARAGPRAAGVDLSGVETVPEPTGLAVVLVQPDGAKTIVRTPGANAAAADRSGAVAAAIESAHDPIVVVDLEVPRPLVDAVVSAARRRRAPVVFDPSPPGEVDDRLLDGVDVITPDHVEAAALTGVATTSEDGALEAAIALHERGVPVALVKLDSGGCAVAAAEAVGVVARPDAVVVDTNGAGDAFAAGVAWAIARREPAVGLALAGVAASSWAIEHRGPQAGGANRRRFDELRSQLTFEPRRPPAAS